MTAAREFVTDGGLETDLIFHRGGDLPDFAAFPLVADAGGRRLLADYYTAYAAIAASAEAGLLLETPTWRANQDWATGLGYDAGSLAGINREAVTFLRGLAETWSDRVGETRVSGQIGPRGDGYRPGAAVDPDEADLATALTLTDVGEALGVVAAARDVGLPVAVSFTVETDGRLPGGMTVAEAVAEVDAAGGPAYFLLNCAHPEHIERGLGEDGAWRERIQGLRVNASTMSHEELDEAEELDDGDPVALASAHERLEAALPAVRIVGGCCGTDARHVAAMWGQPAPLA